MKSFCAFAGATFDSSSWEPKSFRALSYFFSRVDMARAKASEPLIYSSTTVCPKASAESTAPLPTERHHPCKRLFFPCVRQEEANAQQPHLCRARIIAAMGERHRLIAPHYPKNIGPGHSPIGAVVCTTKAFDTPSVAPRRSVLTSASTSFASALCMHDFARNWAPAPNRLRRRIFEAGSASCGRGITDVWRRGSIGGRGADREPR